MKTYAIIYHGAPYFGGYGHIVERYETADGAEAEAFSRYAGTTGALDHAVARLVGGIINTPDVGAVAPSDYAVVGTAGEWWDERAGKWIANTLSS